MVPPCGVNLIALLSRFQMTCWRRSGSASTAIGSRREVERQGDALLRRHGAYAVHGVHHDSCEFAGTSIDREGTGLETGKVEQVADELSLRLGVAIDLADRAAQGGHCVGRGIAQEQLRKTYDAVEWAA